MNDYYINPMTLYGIEIIRNINSILNFAFAICCVLVCYLLFKCFVTKRNLDKIDKTVATIWIVLAVLLTFIPSEKAMYRMLIASYFTKENTQDALETIDMATNKLINKIIKAREKK